MKEVKKKLLEAHEHHNKSPDYCPNPVLRGAARCYRVEGLYFVTDTHDI